MSDPPLPFKVGFEDVVDYMSHPDMRGDFPKDILRARLEAIGTQEALEKNAIAKHGFPFRYHSPLDEAILVLHYFLTKSQQYPGSYIHIHSTHVPTKEEENTLASWKSPKAGLYLDLHAVIENHNHAWDKSGRIKRLFVFRDHAQLAFLESTGIGVILEQESIGIETGFLLISEDRDKVEEITGAGVMLVELFDDDINKCEWFLGIAKDQSQHPYLNNLTCRWHRGRRLFDNKGELTPEAKQSQIAIEKYLQLFTFEDRDPEENHINRSYRFPSDADRFRRLLKKNYKEAFSAGEVSKAEFRQHLKYRAIPGNLEQLLLALEQINESSEIKAIDSSSVKNTLRVHEADPNYRHWIRTTVQRALKNPTISLERIYILPEIGSEYDVLKQEIALYHDLISNRISRLERRQSADKAADSSFQNNGPVNIPSYDGSVNIRLYAITMKAIDETFRRTPQHIKTELRKLLKEDFYLRDNLKVSYIIKKLDFLYSERLVFNYKDYKGEPGRAFYEADLFIPEEYATPQARESRKAQCLSADEFAERREKYKRLFEILKQRSIQLFPNPGEDLSKLRNLERKLESKGIQPLTIDEVLDVSEVIQSHADEVAVTWTPTIFVSYASDDKPKVRQICQELSVADYAVWEYEDGIPVGTHPIEEQDQAIRECTFFLCCWSQAYSRRLDGQIPREIEQALKRHAEEFRPKRHRFFLLVRLDDTEVRSDLAENFKYITLFKKDSWQPDEWRKLLEAITTGLNQRRLRPPQ